MTSWFGKKRTPDGTEIIRHDEVETQIDVMEKNTSSFKKAREAVYEKLFGEPLGVSHELLPLIPHIDVYTFKRTSKKDGVDQVVYSLVTGGMSDLEMTLPQRAPKDVPRRVELIFYCSEPRAEYISTLRWVAHFPHNAKSWLGHGHTMPNGNPPAHFWGSKELDTLLFMPPIVVKDQNLPFELQIEGQPVHFLWVVPLTTAECDYKLEKGFDAILGLFQQHHHPHVFDPNRRSYV
jgi:Suppressor of fused protein (SUFU)